MDNFFTIKQQDFIWWYFLLSCIGYSVSLVHLNFKHGNFKYILYIPWLLVIALGISKFFYDLVNKRFVENWHVTIIFVVINIIVLLESLGIRIVRHIKVEINGDYDSDFDYDYDYGWGHDCDDSDECH